MTEFELNNEYFEWMCQLVCNERYSRRLSYQKLLRHLHNIDFQYMLPMDGNRAEDGIDLRYRFGYEKEYEGPMISSYLDINHFGDDTCFFWILGIHPGAKQTKSC